MRPSVMEKVQEGIRNYFKKKPDFPNKEIKIPLSHDLTFRIEIPGYGADSMCVGSKMQSAKFCKVRCVETGVEL
jgi:hypothetical protein